LAFAPGVASALSTTVFGLIVAIPALFGYNFLASRIKNISAEMDIFLEQFLLRVENTYGG
jgi:biopolymer transport protein ExbB